MTVKDTRSRIQARLWQAVAQSELDLSALSKAELEALVELATDAALLEMDEDIEKSTAADQSAMARYYPKDDKSDELVLWEGRPFVSISEHFVITNQRIRVVQGLLGKDRQDVELIRVQDIDQSQTLRERMLNLGDITIRSHDSTTPLIILNNIRNPQEVHELLRRAVNDVRSKHKLTFQEEM